MRIILPAALFLIIAMVIMLRLGYRLALLVPIFAPLPAVIALRAATERS
jgi:ATP-binding cassette, subfamily B, bacterial